MSNFSTPLECSKCGSVGSATWEGPLMASANPPVFMLMAVSGSFYERVQKKNPSQTEIVCGACETVAPRSSLTPP
jgi:hypothetical protein